ncbi:Hcp family type VI secretion system effector [Paucibacter sp. Y2R2-4]|uniref:Hcp family type VI secretion system effector n=1 Tax=Paucibacter sp. Y2R2-4 TaxID=2893553 RepID=UPI0021E3CB71|nr:type VI secretion system tube protein Hcp [Paucibacter sp. Y2R2-4]MCV2348289.1 type VI secretion system tube protein Hcp [Paucibacter sp. Y2R2-4]
MSIDFYLKVDGVDGESTHIEHAGEIALLNWSWGVRSGSASASATGVATGPGKTSPGDFVFSHIYDKASPLLAKHCVSGKVLKVLKLSARKSGDGQKDFLLITMKDVLLTSVAPAANADGEILEEVHCTYRDIEFAYKPMDKTGGLGAPVIFGWNVATNATR